jgi:phage shock protein B
MDDLAAIVIALAFIVLLGFIIKMGHDRKLRRMNLQGLSQEEQRVLADIGEVARRMEQRIENLERVLDAEVAGWRSRVSL